MARSVVVLPAPFAPMSVTMLPFSTFSEDAVQRADGAVADDEIFDLKHRRPPFPR